MKLKTGEVFFPVFRIIRNFTSQVVEDGPVEPFHLRVGLGVVRGRGGVLGAQQLEEVVHHLVAELLALVGVDLFWWGEPVDPVVEDGLGYRGGLLVRQRHQDGDLGEGVGDGQDVLVVGV